jgi:hypothetical protein
MSSDKTRTEGTKSSDVSCGPNRLLRLNLSREVIHRQLTSLVLLRIPLYEGC